MGDIRYGGEDIGEGLFSRELRRPYHDRIAEVKERSLEVLRCSIAGADFAARALSARGGPPVSHTWCSIEDMRAVAAAVDAEVVSLLALESPMARDLRVILASRDVTQIGLLCVGLCTSMAPRLERAATALDPARRSVLGEAASGTEGLIREAEAGWAALDDTMPSRVERSAIHVRALQTEFLASLLGLVGVPMDAAIDLSMVSRALERLVDHAVEIGERVEFVVHGTTAPPAQI